eukprot:2835431-Heterocapsa_arctica.AAC.1
MPPGVVRTAVAHRPCAYAVVRSRSARSIPHRQDCRLILWAMSRAPPCGCPSRDLRCSSDTMAHMEGA